MLRGTLPTHFGGEEWAIPLTMTGILKKNLPILSELVDVGVLKSRQIISPSFSFFLWNSTFTRCITPGWEPWQNVAVDRPIFTSIPTGSCWFWGMCLKSYWGASGLGAGTRFSWQCWMGGGRGPAARPWSLLHLREVRTGGLSPSELSICASLYAPSELLSNFCSYS